MLAMMLSAMNVRSNDILSLKKTPHIILYSLLLNYVVLGGLFLLMARFLIDDPEIWTGFVILAAVPPAVAVTPFSHSLGGNTRFALVGMTACYIAAIAIIPVIMLTVLNVSYFDPVRLIVILGELVVGPILVSRVLLLLNTERYIAPWRGTTLNWSFFLVIFTLIGLNRHAFLTDFGVLFRIGIIAFTGTFVLGYLIELVSRVAGITRETMISAILMGTMKNYGLAGGILLSLFSERSTIPPSVCVVFGVLIVVWLGFRYRKYGA